MNHTNEPYSEHEMEIMWEAEMKRHESCSIEFRKLIYWMFDLEEFKKVMRSAHLPNPFLKMVSKKKDTI